SHPAGVGPFGPHALAAGDVDGDGDVDLVVSDPFNPFGGQIQLLSNQGSCQLAPPVQLLAGFLAPDSLCLVDLDGDTLLDLVAERDADILVAKGDGQGGFATPSVLSVFPFTHSVAVGDVTGDGNLDLIGAGNAILLPPSRIYVLPGNGDGSFGGEQMLLDASFQTVGRPVIGDLDGDGRDDVVAIVDDFGQTQHVQAFLSLGAGQYGVVETTLAMPAKDIALADFDGDGFLDLAYFEVLPPGATVRIAPGDGAGGFGPATVAVVEGVDPRGLVVADFDGDRRMDVATASMISGDVCVLRGTGEGSLEGTLVVSGIADAAGLLAADFDGRGFVDLAVVRGWNETGIAVLRNHTYAPEHPFTDLGHALATPVGYPIQLASGTLQADTAVTLRLAAADPSATTWLLVGLSALHMPLQGGVVVPSPDLVVGPVPLAGQTELAFTARWPASAPSGTTLWTQFWLDSGTSLGASSAVRAISP
ncbi:MAG: FG-GAP repeat domain-containing protein, partial [Planctomycetota bacterium]